MGNNTSVSLPVKAPALRYKGGNFVYANIFMQIIESGKHIFNRDTAPARFVFYAFDKGALEDS